jgi:hypothetical protein
MAWSRRLCLTNAERVLINTWPGDKTPDYNTGKTSDSVRGIFEKMEKEKRKKGKIIALKS